MAKNKVDTYSEEWRHLCEARHIAALPDLLDRRRYLTGVEEKRGKPERARLEETLRQIWQTRGKGNGRKSAERC